MAGYPAGKSLIERMRHVWVRYIGWGSANPSKRKAVRQLAVSDRITEESKKLTGDAFAQFNDTMRECARSGALSHQPASFVAAILSAIADTTMDFIAREPAQASATLKQGLMRSGTQSPADSGGRFLLSDCGSARACSRISETFASFVTDCTFPQELAMKERTYHYQNNISD